MATFFVTAQTWGRRQFLQSDRMGELFVGTIQDYRAQGKFLLHDYVIMKDHIHVLITPAIPIDKAVQLIKGGFSFRAGKEFGLTGRIWNHSFDGKIVENNAAFEAVRRYIRNNPVRAGMAVNEGEYFFSSAHPSAELDDVPQWLKPENFIR